MFQPPPSEYAIFFVVDTNILLHHFDVLSQFLEDVERLSLPLVIVIPGAVILELDGYVHVFVLQVKLIVKYVWMEGRKTGTDWRGLHVALRHGFWIE